MLPEHRVEQHNVWNPVSYADRGNGVFFVVKECLKSLVPRRMRDGSAAGSDAMRRLSSADGSSPSHFVGLLPWRTYKERK